MKINFREEEIDLNKLMLDEGNPRFAQLYSGHSQKDIINYLLDEEDARDIAIRIAKRKFFRPDKRLLVIEKDGKFLVKDGNRRCAAAKALQDPDKYSLKEGFQIETLPAIVYEKENILDDLIKEDHTSSSFKEWSTIAKALEVFRLSQSKATETELKEVDSDPARLLKIANFYNDAVKIGGERLKVLLRKTGKLGGKLTTFERLFMSSEVCGYKFRDKRMQYSIDIFNEDKFNLYIKAMVDFLHKYPDTTYKDVDKLDDQKIFLPKLATFGFALEASLSAPSSEGEITYRATSPSASISTNVENPDVVTTSVEVSKVSKTTKNGKKIASTNGRKTLIPNHCNMPIPNGYQREINIFYELNTLNVENTPNAVAVLFRLFIEFTTDAYGKSQIVDYEKKYISPPTGNGIKLSGRFQTVVQDVCKKKRLSAPSNVNRFWADKNSIMHASTFNDYVHSAAGHPIPSDLKTTWDNLSPMLENIWQELK